MTSKQQQWRKSLKKNPSIQVRLSLIFPLILVRFACGLKQIPQKNDSNMPTLEAQFLSYFSRSFLNFADVCIWSEYMYVVWTQS